MTADDIISRAEILVEEEYASTDWKGFMEGVLRDLTPSAKILKDEDITVTISSGEATMTISSTLPNLYELVDVSFLPTGGRNRPLRRIAPTDSVSVGWSRMENDTIHLRNLPWTAGTATVKYYENLSMTASTVTTGDYTFNLPAQHHEVLLLGVCAYAMQKEEELDRKSDFYAEYMMGKRKMMAERTAEIEPWNRQYVAQIKVGEA